MRSLHRDVVDQPNAVNPGGNHDHR
ncbi:MAG: hypothetical protein RL743_218, partial [Actinomycetota bacterium]